MYWSSEMDLLCKWRLHLIYYIVVLPKEAGNSSELNTAERVIYAHAPFRHNVVWSPIVVQVDFSFRFWSIYAAFQYQNRCEFLGQQKSRDLYCNILMASHVHIMARTNDTSLPLQGRPSVSKIRENPERDGAQATANPPFSHLFLVNLGLCESNGQELLIRHWCQDICGWISVPAYHWVEGTPNSEKVGHFRSQKNARKTGKTGSMRKMQDHQPCYRKDYSIFYSLQCSLTQHMLLRLP